MHKQHPHYSRTTPRQIPWQQLLRGWKLQDRAQQLGSLQALLHLLKVGWPRMSMCLASCRTDDGPRCLRPRVRMVCNTHFIDPFKYCIFSTK